MTIKPPFTELDIKVAKGGFYEGYCIPITLTSKIVIALLVVWALLFPLNANGMLSAINTTLLEDFNAFYIVAVGGFAFFCLAVALIPASGKRLLGQPGDRPEFSTFSWFSMMFGAGLGVGLMVYATAEPMGLWSSNPVLIDQNLEPNSAEAVRSAMRYTFLHYGFHAWSIYVVTGLALAYYAYRRDMPLTLRSALTPLLGRFANGLIGHAVDILGVIATILGVSVTIGFGVSQFVDGIYAISDMSWLVNLDDAGAPVPSTVGLIAALIVIMGLSILSAVSGVGRGIKWLSNLNLVLSLVLLLTFVVFGAFLFAMTEYGKTLVDYMMQFFALSLDAYPPLEESTFTAALPDTLQRLPAADVAAVYTGAVNPWGSFDGFKSELPASFGTLENSDALASTAYEAGLAGRLFNWQAGWTTFYWAWWIAFSPFVGLFLARISKGRTVREFVLGCVIAPALVCFAWMTILGSTAIDLELSGVAEGTIIAASTTAKLFATLGEMISGGLLYGITVMCVVLIMTFLVTSADSGILVMNTIMSGGSAETGIKHRIIWGLILTTVIAALIIAGGSGAAANPLDALKNAMIIGALPFTVVMVLICVSLAKAFLRDYLREHYGTQELALSR